MNPLQADEQVDQFSVRAEAYFNMRHEGVAVLESRPANRTHKGGEHHG